LTRPDSRTNAPALFPATHLVLLLAVAGVLFFAGLGRWPLLEPDEGRNAEVAREMLLSGDWVTPHFNAYPYLDKPAVFFWLVAGSFRVWGVGEGAARAPSALMALATLLLTWWLARKMFGDGVALRAGIIFATCPLVMGLARLVIFDMTLTFLLTLSLASFWLAEEGDFRNAAWDALLFAVMGVATITKGPVGFLLPLLSILAYEALRGRVRDLKRLRWGWGVAVFLAAVLPWFIAVSMRHPDFPRYALWQESWKRFAGGYVHRKGGVLYYVPVYLAGFFPWSLPLLFAGWHRLRRWKELKQEENRAALFLLSVGAVTFVFFSVSQSQLPGYFLPAIVPLSILLAQVWQETEAPERRRPPDWLTAGLAALLGVGLLLALASQPWVFAASKARWARKIPPAAFGLLRPSLLYSGLILAALAIVGRNLAARARGRLLAAATLALLAFTTPLLVVRWLVPLKAYVESHSSRRLAETLLASPEKDLPLYGYYYFRTSLPFYLRRPVGLVTFDASELTSNYLAFRYRELARRKASSRATLPMTSAARHPTFMDIDPAPLSGRRLLDVLELIDLTKSSAGPRLILVRNMLVGNLAQSVPRLEPLWNGWDYSVWEIPAAGGAADQAIPSRIVAPFRP
jgi:hypothetical protein